MTRMEEKRNTMMKNFPKQKTLQIVMEYTGNLYG